MKKFLILIICCIFVFSCTSNENARKFGGTETVILPVGQKFVNATWKEANLWYITRDVSPNEQCNQTYRFKESSSYGVWEGTVIFVETPNNVSTKDTMTWHQQ